MTGGGQDAKPQQALAEIAKPLADGKIEVTVRTFPLAHAAEALAISQGGHVRGKLVCFPYRGWRRPVTQSWPLRVVDLKYAGPDRVALITFDPSLAKSRSQPGRTSVL